MSNKYFLIFPITFLCAMSHEMICVCTLTGILLFFVSSILSRVKTKKQLTVIFLALLCTFLGLYVLLKAGAFFRKTPNLEFNQIFLLNIVHSLPSFCIEYLKYVFLNHIFQFILIISQIIYIKKNNNDNDVVKLISAFIFGFLIFFFLLIALGKTYYDGHSYWVIHYDMHVMTDLIFLSFNMALLNIILTKFKFSYNINKAIFVIIVAFILLSIFFIIRNNIFYNDVINKFFKPLKSDAYKTEKILRLANLKGKIAYLDKELLENPHHHGFFADFNDRKINHLYFFSNFIIYYNKFDAKLTHGFIFTNKEKVDEEFKNNHGVFTTEELKDIKFTRLLDNDFVMNNKQLGSCDKSKKFFRK